MNEAMVLDLTRLALAAVFLLAGTKAFTHGSAYHAMLAGFGVPAAAVRPLAVTLPLVELAVGAGMLVPGLVSTAAAVASGLLCSYTTVIGYTLLTGKRPSCNCFGQLSDKPISAMTLLRNGALILLASLLAWRAGAAGTGDGLRVSAAGAVIVAVLFLQGWTIAHLLGQQGRLLLRIDNVELQLRAAGIDEVAPAPAAQGQRGLAIGTLAPDFQASRMADGTTHALSRVRALDRPTVLVFSDAACGPCKELMPRLAEWRRRHADRLAFLVITTSAPPGTPTNDNPLAGLTYVQNGRDAAALYQASATPSAVVVSPEGAIASTLATGAGQIEQLVNAVAAAQGSADRQPQAAQWRTA